MVNIVVEVLRLFNNLLNVINNRYSEWKRQKEQEKQARLQQVLDILKRLCEIAYPRDSTWENMDSALNAYRVLHNLIGQYFDGMQGSFRGILKASDYYHQLCVARNYLKLLCDGTITYSADDFRQFYSDVHWFVQVMAWHEVQCTKTCFSLDFFLFSNWYRVLQRQLVAVASNA